MFSPKQFVLGVVYYSKALGVYWRLRNYLKRDFIRDLHFPSNLQKDYFYASPYYNRTKQYMHANHFFGELLCVLRNYKMDDAERMRFANLSAVAPLFDDFFDKPKIDLQQIKYLLNNPDVQNAHNEEQRLAVIFLRNILQSIENEDDFLSVANQLFTAQNQALENQNKEVPKEYLFELSRQKGGYSGLMYALLLNWHLDENERELAFDLGAFGQLMDDIFDLYDDKKAGIATLANTADAVLELQQIVQKTLSEITDKIHVLNYNSKAKRQFINILSIFASSIHLALDSYQKIENSQQIKPKDCLRIDRTPWIVDMESPKNLLKMFFASLSYLH
ncbi:MAG: hypothetical protein JW729_02945 [Bacteroidales bacterium]|nr:hypothetical protein [Bacteroidales bacterium]